MTPETLMKLCESHGGFETPNLNSNLYAHFKGFQRIQNLEPYTELKALWLESNGLQKLEGLNTLTKLRCLYVQQNLLTRIENVQCLVRTLKCAQAAKSSHPDRECPVSDVSQDLDISQNRLTKLEGIGVLPLLSNLNASKNFLIDGESIQEIGLCQVLSTLDLSNNSLEGDAVTDIICQTPALLSLNLTGNPVMSTPQLRKKMICRISKLAYLDRPVFEAERLAAEAWGRGGREAEVEARANYREAQLQKARNEADSFREWKAAKIKERVKKDANSGAALAGSTITSKAATFGCLSGDSSTTANQSAPPKSLVQAIQADPNVGDFWATSTEEPCPVPNEQGKFDVASFRASSFIPEPVSYVDVLPPLPPAFEVSPQGSLLSGIAIETLQDTEHGTPKGLEPTNTNTNFDDLD
eukprot:CAMPEP_0171796232 /NCGR_PEP_ID=MMETSP0991-20121206/69204_1 /TAXON_ID=483369 /ORGANISM="non described non described, Strain CCMP2098" /LENGTH=411 /DNA_ID=CAMNT_0012406997 /DNA_START=18 /DNA_END=1254 /DNA_ORIENTATION=+